MEQTVRETLCTLIRRYGHSLSDDPTRCQGMLNDLLRGEHKREVFVLVSALKAGIGDDLLHSGGGLPAPLLLGRLRQRLENDLAMAGEAAHWAVETWALALGVIDAPLPVQPAPAPSPRPAPRPRAQTPIPAPPPPTPSGIPDIHGWPEDQVQALQRAAAQRLGLPVFFRDPKFQVRIKERVKTGERKRWFSAPEPVYEERELVKTLTPPEMAVIPAGRFLMGSPTGEAKRSGDEGPQHQVTLSRPFAIGRYAVTFDEYDAFCAATGRGKPGDEGWGRTRRPVINVTWDDAVAYCQWLSRQTGRAYRLPTEAEWEYACRAGTTTPFHFGETLSTDQANYDGNYPYGNGPKGLYRKQTAPVGSLPANPWGLCEVHGNVWEWCQDWHGPYAAGPITDPVGPASGGWRVLRGGRWILVAVRLRCASRRGGDPGYRYRGTGFRLALGPELRQVRQAS